MRVCETGAGCVCEVALHRLRTGLADSAHPPIALMVRDGIADLADVSQLRSGRRCGCRAQRRLDDVWTSGRLASVPANDARWPQ